MGASGSARRGWSGGSTVARVVLLTVLAATACRASPPGAGTCAPPGLPVVAVPASHPGSLLALLITADGDWVRFDRRLADTLAAAGIPVVALRARAFMARPLTADSVARAVEGILRGCLAGSGARRVVLIGYSRGADWMPLVAERLPPDLRQRVQLLVLVGPGLGAGFSFHLADLLRDTPRPTDQPTLPALERLRGTPILCIYGRKEGHSLCPAAPPGLVTIARHPGGHTAHDGRRVGSLILDALH